MPMMYQGTDEGFGATNKSGMYAATCAGPNGPDYTAEVGKDRFDHCRAKNLIYQSTDPRPSTPQKSGKKGAPGGLSAHQAPYATIEEAASTKPSMMSPSAAASMPVGGSKHLVPGLVADETLPQGGLGFDPAVYAANRMANQKIKQESSRRNFNGNGAILSHPVGDTAFPKP